MAEEKLQVSNIYGVLTLSQNIYLNFFVELLPFTFNLIHLALLKRQGINVKGLLKAETPKEEPQPFIDCTGNLQVIRRVYSDYKWFSKPASYIFT